MLTLLLRILNVVCKLAWQLHTITASDLRLCVNDSWNVPRELVMLSFIKAKKTNLIDVHSERSQLKGMRIDLFCKAVFSICLNC